MKYLLFSLAVLMVGLGTEAATVSWNSTTIKGVDTTQNGAFSASAIGRDKAEGQLYRINGDEYGDWITLLTGAATLAEQQTQMNALYEGLEKGTIGTGKISDPVKTKASSQANIIDPVEYTGMTGDNPIDAFAAVVYSTTVGEEKYVIANVGKVHMEADVEDSLGNLAATFGGANGTTAIKGWAAVSAPEPTSGLLLLLGMAGLALRRRRV